MNITVTQGTPQSITVQQESDLYVVNTSPSNIVDVGNGLPQQNLYVGKDQPLFSGPGIWIQTGLGANGDDFTFWIETGA